MKQILKPYSMALNEKTKTRIEKLNKKRTMYVNNVKQYRHKITIVVQKDLSRKNIYKYKCSIHSSLNEIKKIEKEILQIQNNLNLLY